MTILIAVISILLSFFVAWIIVFIYKKRRELHPKPLYHRRMHFSFRIGKLFIVIGTKPRQLWSISTSSLAAPSTRPTITLRTRRSGQTTDSITPIAHSTLDRNIESTVIAPEESSIISTKLVWEDYWRAYRKGYLDFIWTEWTLLRYFQSPCIRVFHAMNLHKSVFTYTSSA